MQFHVELSINVKYHIFNLKFFYLSLSFLSRQLPLEIDNIMNSSSKFSMIDIAKRKFKGVDNNKIKYYKTTINTYSNLFAQGRII